ncbi:hypothetical protein BC628DRAFT_1382615 [Trametes gibbosa]|nr:hypothetical protein BC628DRAFT_1382615 [Trametes gibbosa]
MAITAVLQVTDRERSALVDDTDRCLLTDQICPHVTQRPSQVSWPTQHPASVSVGHGSAVKLHSSSFEGRAPHPQR